MILSRKIGVPMVGLVGSPSRSAGICLDLVVVLGTESTSCLLFMVLDIPLIEPSDFLFPLYFMFTYYFLIFLMRQNLNS